jgi:hypothetical protein
LAAGLQFSAGLLSGNFLWISQTFGNAPSPSGGRDLFSGSSLDLAVYQLRPMPGGYPGHLSYGYGLWNFSVGENRGSLVAADIFPDLEGFGDSFPFCPVSFEKNFGNCKNFVCIWGKMGYNKVYENLEITSKAERGNPWQTRAPRKSK